MTDLITDTVAVGEKDDRVCLEFPKPIMWATFDPDTAKQIGLAMAKKAYDLHIGKETEATGVQVVSKELEAKLITRLTHVIKNLTEKNKQPGYIANEVLTIVLREVT